MSFYYHQKSYQKNIEVSFNGRVANEYVLKYYKEYYIDLFINVIATEGVPVSIMEAFSFGIPCFASDVGGTDEIVNSTNGFLVQKDFNLQELETAILAIKEKTKKNKLREHARQT